MDFKGFKEIAWIWCNFNGFKDSKGFQNIFRGFNGFQEIPKYLKDLDGFVDRDFKEFWYIWKNLTGF